MGNFAHFFVAKISFVRFYNCFIIQKVGFLLYNSIVNCIKCPYNNLKTVWRLQNKIKS